MQCEGEAVKLVCVALRLQGRGAAVEFGLRPKDEVVVQDARDVVKILAFARQRGGHVTFRGAGTSLSGQADTDDTLVNVRGFSTCLVLDHGARVRLGSGVVLNRANRELERYGYRLGPDPGSADVATVGGVIANNAAGMRCGLEWDAYSTVQAMTLVLASGSVIDTSSPAGEREFATAAPMLARGLEDLRGTIANNSALVERIGRKFAIRNTMGYRLSAFLDADSPAEIFRRLVVGSEGTLAFIADATFRTRAEPAVIAAGMLLCASVADAVAAVPALMAAGARAVEMMTRRALKAASEVTPGAHALWDCIQDGSVALLVEFGAETRAELLTSFRALHSDLRVRGLIRGATLSCDRSAIAGFWSARRDIFPGVSGAMHELVEDVCVEPAKLGDFVSDLQETLVRWGFDTEIAGHVSVGNVHFQLALDPASPADIARYEGLTEELVAIVVDRYDGTLKGEHGTGRRMLPFVEREWGAEAAKIMREIKQLADPDGVLNRGAVIAYESEEERTHDDEHSRPSRAGALPYR